MNEKELQEKRKLMAKLLSEDPDLGQTILPEFLKILTSGEFEECFEPVPKDGERLGKASPAFLALYTLTKQYERHLELLVAKISQKFPGEEDIFSKLSDEERVQMGRIQRAVYVAHELMAHFVSTSYENGSIHKGAAVVNLHEGNVLVLQKIDIEEYLAAEFGITPKTETDPYPTKTFFLDSRPFK